MELGDLIFWPVALVAIVCAVLVVTRKNPIYSAFFLIGCLLTIAVLLVMLDSLFLAGVHVLVYVGAIMVLFLFIIMLLNLSSEALGKEYPVGMRILTAFVCTCIFALLLFVFYQSGDKPRPEVDGFGSVEYVGTALFTKFVLPFELISLLIIVAIIGAIVLAKRN